MWSPIPDTSAKSWPEHRNGTSAPTLAATLSAPKRNSTAAAFPEPAPNPEPGGMLLFIFTFSGGILKPSSRAIRRAFATMFSPFRGIFAFTMSTPAVDSEMYSTSPDGTRINVETKL